MLAHRLNKPILNAMIVSLIKWRVFFIVFLMQLILDLIMRRHFPVFEPIININRYHGHQQKRINEISSVFVSTVPQFIRVIYNEIK